MYENRKVQLVESEEKFCFVRLIGSYLGVSNQCGRIPYLHTDLDLVRRTNRKGKNSIAYLSVCVRPDAITLIRQLHALF
jgi:hypothetical protein